MTPANFGIGSPVFFWKRRKPREEREPDQRYASRAHAVHRGNPTPPVRKALLERSPGLIRARIVTMCPGRRVVRALAVSLRRPHHSPGISSMAKILGGIGTSHVPTI